MDELELYRRQGYGNRSGFGGSPGLVVVDFVNGFADPEQFGGGNNRRHQPKGDGESLGRPALAEEWARPLPPLSSSPPPCTLVLIETRPSRVVKSATQVEYLHWAGSCRRYRGIRRLATAD